MPFFIYTPPNLFSDQNLQTQNVFVKYLHMLVLSSFHNNNINNFRNTTVLVVDRTLMPLHRCLENFRMNFIILISLGLTTNPAAKEKPAM